MNAIKIREETCIGKFDNDHQSLEWDYDSSCGTFNCSTSSSATDMAAIMDSGYSSPMNTSFTYDESNDASIVLPEHCASEIIAEINEIHNKEDNKREILEKTIESLGKENTEICAKNSTKKNYLIIAVFALSSITCISIANAFVNIQALSVATKIFCIVMPLIVLTSIATHHVINTKLEDASASQNKDAFCVNVFSVC